MCYNPKPLQFLPFIFLSHINLREKRYSCTETLVGFHLDEETGPQRHMGLSVVLLGDKPICVPQPPQPRFRTDPSASNLVPAGDVGI